MHHRIITEYIDTPIGTIPKVATSLTWRDTLGTLKVRFGIKRMSYSVPPGIYAVGNPTNNSLVLVTANYKLTFDSLRKELTGIDAWILVLNTKGINVWCAAGKGTFSTMELLNKISATKLEQLVNHKRLVLPQFGAVGVAAQSVKLFSGFTVTYGPIYAKDIKSFIDAGMKATPAMRNVSFNLVDRLVLVPMEIRIGLKYISYAVLALFFISGFTSQGFSTHTLLHDGLQSSFIILCGFLAGALLGPLLLPWLPGRSFSFKGFFAGLLVFLFLSVIQYIDTALITSSMYFLLITSIASFTLMNFTGASTYTSLSGVRKEMRRAVPIQLGSVIIAALLFVVTRFISL